MMLNIQRTGHATATAVGRPLRLFIGKVSIDGLRFMRDF
jgi:hypothetical protein